MPRISIIVPVYQVEKYLERCVNSILKQYYRDFELILVNDGSKDKSGEICDNLKKIDNRITVIHKENGGLSSARNAGLEIAKGEYVGFIDSDDWITEDMFEHLINLIDKYKCQIASCSYIFSNGNTVFKQPELNIKVFNKTEALIYYMQDGMENRISDYSAWIKLYSKELFKSTKFPIGQLYEDGATNFELIQKVDRYVKSNKICYYYFQDGESITRGGFKIRDIDLIKVGDDFIRLASAENNEKLMRLAVEKKARSYFSLLAKILVYGFSEECNEQEIISNLTKELRKNYFILIKSNMPLNRKIIMTLLCINSRLTYIIMKKIRER